MERIKLKKKRFEEYYTLKVKNILQLICGGYKLLDWDRIAMIDLQRIASLSFKDSHVDYIYV